MLGNLSNVTTTYKIKDVIGALERNKTLHIADYATNLEIYNKERLARAKKVVKELKKGTEPIIGWNFDLKAPINAEKSYDRMLAIFRSMQTESGTIELDFSQADSVFNDNWEWLGEAKAISATYATFRR